LAGNFGPNATSHHAIDFADFESAPSAYLDQDGLDFGLVSLRPYYRSLLSTDGVVPIVEDHWRNQVGVEFDRYMMLGPPPQPLSRQTYSRHLKGTMPPWHLALP
jgi:hypothetical protein